MKFLINRLKDIKVIDIKQYENKERDRPEFVNKYLKLIYFLRYEGIGSTLRKYFAHKNDQTRYLTFLVIEFQSKKYLNISVQFCQNPDEFVIENKFYEDLLFNQSEIEQKFDYYLNAFNQFSGSNNFNLLHRNNYNAIRLQLDPLEFPSIEESKGLFVYGLGGYVRMFIMQHFNNIPKVACIDFKSEISRSFKNKYGFKYNFATPEDSFALLQKVKNPIAIIATYHSDHASIAYEIHKSNPNAFIFIEKPPIVTLEDLNRLIKLYQQGAKIEIGFNRRFIGFTRFVKQKVKDKVITVSCSVKEVVINSNHWYLWENQGTRITGNVVHWFDLATFWIDSIPVEINVLANPYDAETSAISVLYKNGSILNITACDKGNSMRGVQEKIEVRFDNETIFINDFLSMSHVKRSGWKVSRRKLFRRKGHNAMYKNFKKIIKGKMKSEYSVSDLIRTSIVTFYASHMLKNNIKNMKIEDEIKNYFDLAKTDRI